MRRWPRRLIRLLLIPPIYFAAAVIGWTVFSLPVRVDTRTALVPALAGFAGALCLYGLGIRFIRVYVFGHELTHWVAAKLFRRRTGRFRVGHSGGSVEVENPNVVIVLAPYVTPVYSLALIGAYGIVCLAWDPLPTWAISAFCAGLGATYAFHLVLTWLSLKAGQQDLRMFGPVFSVGIILLGNLLLIFVAMVVVGRHWERAPGELLGHTRALARMLAGAGRWILHTVGGALRA